MENARSQAAGVGGLSLKHKSIGVAKFLGE